MAFEQMAADMAPGVAKRDELRRVRRQEQAPVPRAAPLGGTPATPTPAVSTMAPPAVQQPAGSYLQYDPALAGLDGGMPAPPGQDIVTYGDGDDEPGFGMPGFGGEPGFGMPATAVGDLNVGRTGYGGDIGFGMPGSVPPPHESHPRAPPPGETADSGYWTQDADGNWYWEDTRAHITPDTPDDTPDTPDDDYGGLLEDYFDAASAEGDFDALRDLSDEERDAALRRMYEGMAGRGMAQSGAAGGAAFDISRGAARDLAVEFENMRQNKVREMHDAASLLFEDKWRELDRAHQKEMAEIMFNYQKEIAAYLNALQSGNPGQIEDMFNDMDKAFPLGKVGKWLRTWMNDLWK